MYKLHSYRMVKRIVNNYFQTSLYFNIYINFNYTNVIYLNSKNKKLPG